MNHDTRSVLALRLLQFFKSSQQFCCRVVDINARKSSVVDFSPFLSSSANQWAFSENQQFNTRPKKTLKTQNEMQREQETLTKSIRHPRARAWESRMRVYRAQGGACCVSHVSFDGVSLQLRWSTDHGAIEDTDCPRISLSLSLSPPLSLTVSA